MPRFIYICLSELPLPASVTSDVVFPLLAWKDTTTGEEDEYRWALMVAEENTLLHAVLKTLRFEDDGQVPDGFHPSGTWRLLYLDDGPVAPFDNSSGDTKRRLTTYLDLDLPAGSHDPLVRPDAITVKLREVDDSLLQLDRPLPLTAMGCSPDSSHFEFFFADPGSPSVIAPGFLMTLDTLPGFKLGGATVEFPDCALEIRLQTTGGGAEWQGGRVRAGLANVAGDTSSGRLEVGKNCFLQVLSANRLHYEHDLQLPLEFSYLAAGTIRLSIAPRQMRLRFAADVLGIYLQPAAADVPRQVQLQVRGQLIMAGTQAANSLPLVLPASTLDALEPLAFSLTVSLEDTWNREQDAVLQLVGGSLQITQLVLDKAAGAAVRNEMSLAELTGVKWDLAELFGDGDSRVSFSLTPIAGGAWNASPLNPVVLGMGLSVTVCGRTLSLVMAVEINLRTLRMQSNRVFFKFPYADEEESSQMIDLKFLAIDFPLRVADDKDFFAPPTAGDNDGYFDFEKRQFVLTLSDEQEKLERGKPQLIVPGDLDSYDLSNRLLCELQPFSPEHWPDPPPTDAELMLFRLSGSGMTFHATVQTSHEPVIEDRSEYLRPITIQPHEEREGIASRVVLIDNKLRAASLFAQIQVPGFDNMIAVVEVGLRQTRAGQPPQVLAALQLERSDESPLDQFSVGYLQMKLDEIRLSMTWDTGARRWGLSARVDGEISLGPQVSSLGGLEDLQKDYAIVVRDLDLLNLHKTTGENLALRLSRAVKIRSWTVCLWCSCTTCRSVGGGSLCCPAKGPSSITAIRAPWK